MAPAYSAISTYRLLAAWQAAVAPLGASAAEAVRRRSKPFLLASINDVRDSERRSSRGQQSTSRQLPGSVFDARYQGLSAQAALIDAAIFSSGAPALGAIGTPAHLPGCPSQLEFWQGFILMKLPIPESGHTRDGPAQNDASGGPLRSKDAQPCWRKFYPT